MIEKEKENDDGIRELAGTPQLDDMMKSLLDADSASEKI